MADAKHELVLVDLYDVHPMNARKHAREETKDSLREFGQYKPVVVSEASGFAVAGNGLLLAIRELGWANVWVHIIPGMTPADELRLLALDNRTSDKAGYDQERLLELLDAIADDQQGLVGTGWKPEEREKLAKAMGDAKRRTDELFRQLGHDPADAPDDAPPPQRMTKIILGLPEHQAEELRGMLREFREKYGQLDASDGAVIHHIVRTFTRENP